MVVPHDTQFRFWSRTFAELAPALDEARAALSPAEEIRYRFFRFSADAERFALGRWLLKLALAAWTDEAEITQATAAKARTVRLTEREGRPPFWERAPRNMRLSISRSQERAAVAVGTAQALGVDIEDDERAVNFDVSMRERYFQDQEFTNIADRSEDELRLFALRLWTGKEAIAKASGLGLRIPLREILIKDESVMALPSQIPSSQRCRLRFVDQPGARAAVAWW